MRESVLEQLDEIIGILSMPLSEEERAAGWTPNSQVWFLQMFTELRTCVAESRPFPKHNYIYGMDVSGIDGGKIMHRTAVMMEALDQLRNGVGQ